MRYAAMEEFKISDLEGLTYNDLESNLNADKTFNNLDINVQVTYSVDIEV